MFITGIATPSKTGKFNNVVYLFNYNGLTIAHLGDIGDVPSQKQIEDLEMVNVLLVPVGAGSSLNAARAAELVSMLEPNVVVPMHYQLPGLETPLEPLDKFLKEMGVSEAKRENSLKLTSADSLPQETEVIILAHREQMPAG